MAAMMLPGGPARGAPLPTRRGSRHGRAGRRCSWPATCGVERYRAAGVLRLARFAAPLADATPVGGDSPEGAVAAAVYQVTPLKAVCLRHCRSPMSFFLRHANNLSRPSGAVRAGARHGLYCLGCCWVLMAILISVGTMQIAVMVALAVLILLEKVAPFGEQLARLAAAVFLVLGVVLLAHPTTVGHFA